MAKFETEIVDSEVNAAKLEGKGNPLSGKVEDVQAQFDKLPLYVKNKVCELINELNDKLSNVENTADKDKPISDKAQDALNGKVDKIEGKGLSEKDFTTAEKEKLEGLKNYDDTEIKKELAEVPIKKGTGENSAFFGSSTNNVEDIMPETICYKPIDADYYEIVNGNKRYKFENLMFTVNDGTRLGKLYTYQDKWNNKCYTVYEDYSPDRADGTTDVPQSDAVEVSADDEMLKGLKYEALFNDAKYFAVAEGGNAFSSGEDNAAYGDEAFSAGFRNIVLAGGSTALGRRILVRGVGANGFGLGGKVTGRYAIAFNESGKALGYASLAFGDHCNAYNYYDIAGGFYSTAKGKNSIAIGVKTEASAEGSIAVGQSTKAMGSWCLVAGNRNECSGIGALVVGLENKVSDNYGLTVGEKNQVSGDGSVVAGSGNNVPGRQALVVGNSNDVSGNNGSAAFGNKNIVKGANGALACGLSNNSNGERSFTQGISNIVSGADSAAFGNGNKVSGSTSLAIGYNNDVDNNQCQVIGRRLKTSEPRQTVVGVGNKEEINAVFIVGAGGNNEGEGEKNAIVVHRSKGYVECPQGMVLVSPSGYKYKLKVSNSGVLSTERID